MKNKEYQAFASVILGAPDQWGPDSYQRFWDLELPVVLGPCTIHRSPNWEAYFFDAFGIDPEDQEYPSVWGNYPISCLYVDVTFQVRENNWPDQQADEEFERLEALLRLFQSGDVAVRRHESVFEKIYKRPWFSWGGDYQKPVVRTDYRRPAYRLDDDAIGPLGGLSDRYWGNPVTEHPSVALAIARFNSSYERRNLVDRLVDLVIALEALFGDRGDSLSYKVAARCAYWLEGPGQGRWEIFDSVRKIYNQRSDAVHGTKSLDLDVAQIDDLEDIVRSSVTTYLKLCTTADNVLCGRDLDKPIMTGGL